MSTSKDDDGKFSFGRDKDDGSYRQDRYNWTDKETGDHDHTWSKTDPTTGDHKEGWTGENAPRKDD